MSIRDIVVSSVRWLAIGRFGGQLIAWSITILVVRILSPADYGLMALATLSIGLFAMFEEMGLASAVVQMKELDREKVENVFGLIIVLNVTLYVLVFLAAPLIAAYFEEPELTAILRVAGLQLLFGSLEVIPDAILRHRMAFRGKSIVMFVAVLISSPFTLVLALQGYGVWSLVFGNLLAVAVRTIGLSLVAKYYVRPRLRLSGMRRMVTFGGNVTADRLLWFIYTQADVLIIGKLLSKELLGYYSVAMHLASLPMIKIGGILTEVGFSAFSRMQNDSGDVAAAFRKAIATLSFFSFPIFFGISSVATEAVPVLLGEKWIPSALPLQILSVVVPLRMLNTVVPASLFGIGRADISAVNGLIACVIMPTAFVIGVKWGLLGVCLAWTVAYPVYVFICLQRSLPVIGTTMKDYLASVKGPLLASSVMYCVVTGLRYGLEAYVLRTSVLLVILIVGGAVTYASLVWFLQRTACREVLELIRR